jgi:hypothetical protein
MKTSAAPPAPSTRKNSGRPGREAINTDLFSPDWDFWGCADQDLETLRRDYAAPPVVGA